jgi:hypothetical protein
MMTACCIQDRKSFGSATYLQHSAHKLPGNNENSCDAQNPSARLPWYTMTMTSNTRTISQQGQADCRRT